jgi:hypothetical protein
MSWELLEMDVQGQVISDHSAITFKLPFTKPSRVKRTISIRQLKSIDVEAFRKDLSETTFVTDPADDIDLLSVQYHTCLSQVLSQHAPVTERIVTDRSGFPWFTDNCRKAKSEKRRAERAWRKSKLTVHLDILRQSILDYKVSCKQAKSEYFQHKIEDNSKDQKVLFQVAHTLLHKKKDRRLPTHTNAQDLANDFIGFFSQKIESIRKTFSLSDNVTWNDSDVPSLSKLQPISSESLKKIILASNSKYCHLDPISTGLLRECLPCLLPSITKMINLSINTSTVPKSWKIASVSPLLKKSTLDPEEMKHYRPISNLPYMSKILEKVVLTQLDEHMDKHSLREPCQSAYRPCHSTETAVIKIMNDILCDIDNRKCVLLILLDMSAAFDTVDHSIFLNRMQYDFGICGSANEWLKSYFTDRQQSVIINGATSHLTELTSGMPQGSVIGPKG